MNMKDFFKPELLEPFPPGNSINDYFDNNTHGLPILNPDNRPLIEKVKLPISAADFDYESPISIIREMIEDIGKKQAAELDNQTLEAVLRVGIQVDKEELIKALAYDRNQYTKGFNDGLKRNRASWVGIDEFPHEHYECNRCGYAHITDDISIFKYCPNCGAMMMDEKEEESKA